MAKATHNDSGLRHGWKPCPFKAKNCELLETIRRTSPQSLAELAERTGRKEPNLSRTLKDHGAVRPGADQPPQEEARSPSALSARRRSHGTECIEFREHIENSHPSKRSLGGAPGDTPQRRAPLDKRPCQP